jgi:hypothetical protein
MLRGTVRAEAMTTRRQSAAARKNIKKAANAAKARRTLAAPEENEDRAGKEGKQGEASPREARRRLSF